METLNIDKVIAGLKIRFFLCNFTFAKSENNNILPTIEIKLKDDVYLRDDQFSFKDNFKPELLKTLEKFGITDVTFNNTGHTFWWTEKKYNPITGEEIIQIKEKDIKFWDKAWDELTLDEKAMFCSMAEIPFLATKGEVKDKYNVYKLKYTFYY